MERDYLGWKYNIKMDFQEVGCDGFNWTAWLMIKSNSILF
jgi:hypothetical protein